jgi:hypothetical protein
MTGQHEQPSARPTNKMLAVASSGSVVTIVLVLLDVLSRGDYEGAWWGSGVVTVASFVAGYLRKNA